jgi:hypothetical protein
MSLQDFQKALSDLVMSPTLRARVVEDPTAVLSSYDLSERERRRLETLAKDTRLRTGTLLHRSFRLSLLSNTLPRTCRALGPRGIRELTHAWWSEGPPRTMQYAKEALLFAEFALGKLREGSFQHDFLGEVVETELALLRLGRSGAALQAGERAVPEDLGSRALRLHPACCVVPWRHDPGAVLAALDAGRPLDGFPEGEHFLLIASTGSGGVTMKPVDREAGRALRAADGTRTVDELCAALDLPEQVFADSTAAGWLV